MIEDIFTKSYTTEVLYWDESIESESIIELDVFAENLASLEKTVRNFTGEFFIKILNVELNAGIPCLT